MIKRRDPDPAALREFRERRGWTHEQVADETGASPLEVAAWEAGTVRVPAPQAIRIRALARADLRRAEVLRAGLSPCPWAEANAPGLHERLAMEPWWDDSLAPGERWHVSECAACGRVRDYGLALRLPPLDPRLGYDPRETLVHAMSRAPVQYGVMIGGGALLALVVHQLLLLLPNPPRAEWFADLGAPVLAGIVALHMAGRLMPSFSRKRPYSAGLLEALGAVPAGLLVWAAEDASHHAGGSVLVICAVLVMALGLLAGAFNDWTSGRTAEDEDEAEPEGERPGGLPGIRAPLLGEGAPEPDLARPESAERVSRRAAEEQR